MSLVFAAGKKSAAIVKGQHAEPKRLKRTTSSGSDSSPKRLPPTLFSMVHFTSQIMRSVCVYKPSEDIVVWNPKIDGKEQSIALRKSSMDIWFEDEKLDYNTTTTDGKTSRMDFLLKGKKATIINQLHPESKENSFELLIEGEEIPRMMLPTDQADK